MVGDCAASDEGEWKGSRLVNHLEVNLDTERMRVLVTEEKFARVRKLALKKIFLAQRNKRLVPLGLLRKFCDVFVSLTFALHLERFNTRSLYFEISLEENKEMKGSSGSEE